MKAPTKKEVIEQLKEEIRLRSLDREHHINTAKKLRVAEERIGELEQLTKGTDAFQVCHPSNLSWQRAADHGIRIYTDGAAKQLLTRIPLCTNYGFGEVDSRQKLERLVKLQNILCEAYEDFSDENITVELFMSEEYVNT